MTDRLSSGRLRHAVQLQQQSETKGAAGGVVISWSTVATVRAAVEPSSGAEFIQADQKSSITYANIYIRHGSEWATINTSWRVKFGTRTFNILSVVNKRLTNQTLMLQCIESEIDDQ